MAPTTSKIWEDLILFNSSQRPMLKFRSSKRLNALIHWFLKNKELSDELNLGGWNNPSGIPRLCDLVFDEIGIDRNTLAIVLAVGICMVQIKPEMANQLITTMQQYDRLNSWIEERGWKDILKKPEISEDERLMDEQ